MVYSHAIDANTLIERARTLAPVVADRAATTERLRELPPETMTDLVDAEFFGAIVDVDHGGFGITPDIVCQVGRELAKGCMSTGWITAFLMGHNWLVAQFPEETQHEVFDGGYMLGSAALSPGPTAQPVEGGHRVSGQSPWGSGVQHSDWAMVTGIVRGSDGSPTDVRMFLLPIADVRIDDVWHTDGMRGTGSNTVITSDAFVADRYSISMIELNANGGADELSFIPFLALLAAGPALGGAEAALDAFVARIEERVLAYTLGSKAKERPIAQMRIGRAAAQVRAAAALFERATARMVAGRTDPVESAAIRLDAAKVVEMSRLAVADVCAAAGGSIHFVDEPLQRIQRDVNTLSGHAIFDMDRAAEMHGRLVVGLPPDPMRLL